MAQRKCCLVHVSNRMKIYLPHEQLITLGRNLETQVEDIFVSKKQIECMADIEKCIVNIKPVGKALSGVDGYAIVKDKTYKLGSGHIIELRLGFHPFEIVFEDTDELKGDISPEETKIKPTAAKKLKIDFESIFTENGKWEDIDHKELIIYTPDNIQSRHKIAAFDIDGTIIKTKSGKRFPINGDDWVLNYDDIPQKLSKLYEDGFKIVFFTNQSGVGKDSFKIKDFKRKIENLLKKLFLPIQVYVALKTIYRKPLTGMWNVLKSQKNDNINIDLTESFYVGDAAGREKNWIPKKPKDHSIADRLFALNVGLKFFTPEEYFRKQRPANFSMPAFDPRTLPNLKFPTVDYKEPNIILMVGIPGSGKSHICKSLLVPKGYVHINRDELGTWQKCVKVLEESTKENKSCVVDNTNCDQESRKRYIDITKKYNIPCRCFVMSTSYHHSKHNNRFRELVDKSHIPVNEIIINNLKKNYQKPALTEGFEEIIEVPFVPSFKNDEQSKLYKMFLLEK